MKLNSSDGPHNLDTSRLISITQNAFKRGKRNKVLAVILLCLGIILAGFCLITILERYVYFNSASKLSFMGLLLALSAGLAVRGIRKMGRADFEQFYITFARYASLPPLKHALDLTLHQRDAKLKLYHTALSQNLRLLKEQVIRKRLNEFLKSRSEYKKLRTRALFLCLAAGGVFGLGTFLPDAVLRTLHAWNTYEAPNPYNFSVEPGHVTVEQGSTLAPRVVFKGKFPEDISLAFKTEVEETYRSRPVSQIDQDTVRFSPVTLNTSSSYYIEMDGFRSPRYKAEVQLRPRFETLGVRVTPPPYTKLDSTSYTYPFARIRAYQGSEIILSGILNKKVDKLALIRKAKGDTVLLDVKSDNRFVYSIRFSDTDTLAFSMRDTSGLRNINLFEFVLEPVTDEVPLVQILHPESNLEMKDPRDMELRYEASDDFGITSSHLHFEIHGAFSDAPEKGSVKLQIPRLNEPEQYMWSLEKLNPKPRDVINYWVEVSDNNRYSGPQSARSRTLSITFPSLVEYLDKLENKETTIKETLDEISNSYQQVREDYDRFKEQLKKNPQGNWEQKRSLDEMQQQQEKLYKKVEELNKRFEELRREMSRNNVMSDETLQAYKELQQLMKEINDPELARALEELRRALGNMDQQQLKQALENFEFNEEQYQERINRTIELFKTLKLNSDLEKLATALDKLAEQEKELSEGNESSLNRVEKQKAVQEDTRKLSDELQDLSQDAPERSQENIRKLEEETDRRMNDIQKRLEDNIRKMKERQDDMGRSGKIRDQQKQLQQEFQQMARQMRNAKERLRQQRHQINVAALRYILYSLINLSRNQEDLTRETEYLNNRSQAFVEKARVQQTIADQFEQLSDSLYKVSAKIPGFSNEINEKKLVIGQQLASSVELLAERNKSQATFAERQSLGGINELSAMIASLLDQMQNQGMGGGGGMSMQQFIEQLQKMSGQQLKMNRQIQKLINDLQGDRLSNEQIDRLNQLARQQNQIRRQIKELQQSGGLETGDRILSELERLSEEMEETINDLRGGQADPSMIKRQQNILSRMLSAEEALNERDKKEEREATTAEETPRHVPPDVTLEELEKKIRKLLNDPTYTKFSEDYQKLIEQYFNLLRQLEEEAGV